MMTPEELDRALRHCHRMLGESLVLISNLLERKGEPEDIIRDIAQAQANYNAITRLLKEDGN
jgi:hypothetical protein